MVARVTRLFTHSCDRPSVTQFQSSSRTVDFIMLEYRGWYVVGLSPPFGRSHPSIMVAAFEDPLWEHEGVLEAKVGGVMWGLIFFFGAR